MKALVLVLSLALCACTSQQYAQLNQRVNDSIANALGTRTEPPPPLEWKSETVVDYLADPVPSAQEQADVAYANHIAAMGSVPSVTFTPAPPPKQPTAKGVDLVDGAIVCPSLDEANWLFSRIDQARHARLSLSPELRRQPALVNGYDEGAEPNPAEYRCQFVPAGTPMHVRMDGGYIPVVWGKMNDGRPFSGVTIPNMIDR